MENTRTRVRAYLNVPHALSHWQIRVVGGAGGTKKRTYIHALVHGFFPNLVATTNMGVDDDDVIRDALLRYYQHVVHTHSTAAYIVFAQNLGSVVMDVLTGFYLFVRLCVCTRCFFSVTPAITVIDT